MEEMNERPTTENYFFIYGSLRAGMYNFFNARLTSENVVAEEVKLYNAKLWSINDVFPCVTLGEGKNNYVIGEIHKYHDKKTVDSIDAMEIGALYKRYKVNVTDEKGKQYECVIYVKPRGTDIPVECADWVKYMESKKKR